LQSVGHWETFDTREADNVTEAAQLSTKALLDARDAEIVGPLQAKLTFPDAGIYHTEVADLDDIDAAVDALVPDDLAARHSIVAEVLAHGDHLPFRFSRSPRPNTG
jgi:hypothetical protein